jgi:hypothetical protein
MHDIVELVRAIAWPTTTLVIVLLLRSELQRMAAGLAERIQSANSIVLGRRGIEIKGFNDLAAGNLQQRRLKFKRYVTSIKDKVILDEICNALKVEKSNSPMDERNSILVLARRVSTNEEMDDLTAALKSITGKDF